MKPRKNLLFALSVIILFALYIFLSPHVSSRLNPFKRSAMRNRFENSLLKEKNISPTVFWEFREFYYPGVIIANAFGLKADEIAGSLKMFPVTTASTAQLYPIVLYHSDKITSIEYLTPKSMLAEIVSMLPDKPQIKTGTLVYYRSGKTAYLYFVKPVSDMLTANGYFDYKKRDKKLLENKYWFVETVISMD